MLRALYVDLDGTLLGPGGSLFASGCGEVSLSGARAVETCRRAGVEVVLVTGRPRIKVAETARLLGCSGYVFELGCGLVVDGEVEWLTGGLQPSPELGTIHQQIGVSGATNLVERAFVGRLEPHTPWSIGREASHLMRGDIDVDGANMMLAEAGLPQFRLIDNGVLAAHGIDALGSASRLSNVETAHVYHLLPATASKAAAVARHMQVRGYAARNCIAVGDSREDLQMSSVVSRFFLVANGAWHDRSLGAEAAQASRVQVCEQSYGAGVYEAVLTALADRND